MDSLITAAARAPAARDLPGALKRNALRDDAPGAGATRHRDGVGMAKFFTRRAAETEGHLLEALRLSPRDIAAHGWMLYVGAAKMLLGADAEAVGWLRRSIEVNRKANRNFPLAHFWLASGLGVCSADRMKREPPQRPDLP
jgi:hypothetical protein